LAQEFFINSQELESKIRQLLPSQGGGGAGVDLSASTQIVPIVDLTEQAEGSNVRPDLQTALSHDTVTSFAVRNTTTTIINNTGYFRVFGNYASNGSNVCEFVLNDGSTDKSIIGFVGVATQDIQVPYDFIVFLGAGDSFKASSSSVNAQLGGCTRQIADISGNLTNP